MADVISLVISALALFVAAAANVRSVRAATASSTLAVVTGVFSRRRDAGFQNALDAVRSPQFGRGVDPSEGFVGLTENDRRDAWLVTDFFDDLGKLLAHNLVRENIVIGTFGATALSCWKPLGPFVLGQRAINRSSFQIYFEYLVKRIEKNPPERVLKRMKILSK